MYINTNNNLVRESNSQFMENEERFLLRGKTDDIPKISKRIQMKTYKRNELKLDQQILDIESNKILIVSSNTNNNNRFVKIGSQKDNYNYLGTSETIISPKLFNRFGNMINNIPFSNYNQFKLERGFDFIKEKKNKSEIINENDKSNIISQNMSKISREGLLNNSINGLFNERRNYGKSENLDNGDMKEIELIQMNIIDKNFINKKDISENNLFDRLDINENTLKDNININEFNLKNDVIIDEGDKDIYNNIRNQNLFTKNYSLDLDEKKNVDMISIGNFSERNIDENKNRNKNNRLILEESDLYDFNINKKFNLINIDKENEKIKELNKKNVKKSIFDNSFKNNDSNDQQFNNSNILKVNDKNDGYDIGYSCSENFKNEKIGDIINNINNIESSNKLKSKSYEKENNILNNNKDVTVNSLMENIFENKSEENNQNNKKIIYSEEPKFQINNFYNSESKKNFSIKENNIPFKIDDNPIYNKDLIKSPKSEFQKNKSNILKKLDFDNFDDNINEILNNKYSNPNFEMNKIHFDEKLKEDGKLILENTNKEKNLTLENDVFEKPDPIDKHSSSLIENQNINLFYNKEKINNDDLKIFFKENVIKNEKLKEKQNETNEILITSENEYKSDFDLEKKESIIVLNESNQINYLNINKLSYNIENNFKKNQSYDVKNNFIEETKNNLTNFCVSKENDENLKLNIIMNKNESFDENDLIFKEKVTNKKSNLQPNNYTQNKNIEEKINFLSHEKKINNDIILEDSKFIIDKILNTSNNEKKFEHLEIKGNPIIGDSSNIIEKMDVNFLELKSEENKKYPSSHELTIETEYNKDEKIILNNFGTEDFFSEKIMNHQISIYNNCNNVVKDDNLGSNVDHSIIPKDRKNFDKDKSIHKFDNKNDFELIKKETSSKSLYIDNLDIKIIKDQIKYEKKIVFNNEKESLVCEDINNINFYTNLCNENMIINKIVKTDPNINHDEGMLNTIGSGRETEENKRNNDYDIYYTTDETNFINNHNNQTIRDSNLESNNRIDNIECNEILTLKKTDNLMICKKDEENNNFENKIISEEKKFS